MLTQPPAPEAKAENPPLPRLEEIMPSEVAMGACDFPTALASVYDGHSGPESLCYIKDHLFKHLKKGVFPVDFAFWFVSYIDHGIVVLQGSLQSSNACQLV